MVEFRSALLAWIVLISCSAHANHPFLIESFPPNAEVWDTVGPTYLGRTGQMLSFENKSSRSLFLRLKGHADYPVSIMGLDIDKRRFPVAGSVSLEPLTMSQAAKDQLWYHPWRNGLLLALIILLPMGGAQFVRWRRRTLTLESYVPTEGAENRSLIRERIGEYRVVSPLGQGGMADVYLAVPNKTLEMTAAVAIKVINRDLRADPSFVSRFEREITVSSELAHPGIVEVRDWGWHNDRLYLAMEYIEGQELRKALPGLRGDWKRVVDLLSQLMLAVDYAHQRGVYHRDLKPENVMVTESDRIKVMDFGLARAVDSKTLTQIGQTMGSPKYISPESVAGKGADDRADQYSLGVMVYEIVTGRLPFDSDEVLFLLYSHANVQPEPPSSIADLPKEIDDVILRMLKKDPRERYKTVEEARVELLEVLGNLC